MLDKIKELTKDTALYGISTIVGRFLGFILVPFYTNVFSPEEFGIQSYIYAFLAFVNIVYIYGMDASLNNPHFDLLHFTRRALRSKLENCRLETVEQYLGLKRGINIPSGLVPHFYQTYLKTRNIGPLVPILEHNKQDLLTLACLFSKLYEEWDLC